jgi:hypothetical protein
MRRWPIAVVVLALALPAAASASCRSRLGPDAYEVTSNGQAAVFWRPERSTNDVKMRVYYGCYLASSRLARLHTFRDFDSKVEHLTLVGHQVAFAYLPVDPEDSDSDKIHRHDLRTGRHRTIRVVSRDRDLSGRGAYVRTLVLKPNGTVVWVGSYLAGDQEIFQLNTIEAGRRDRRSRLDEGAEIVHKSLALSSNGKRVYWKNAGEVRSAPLR